MPPWSFSIPLVFWRTTELPHETGILFKGGFVLDSMTQINTVVMDKKQAIRKPKGVFKKIQDLATNQIFTKLNSEVLDRY